MGARPSSFTLTKPGRFRLLSTAELFALPPPTWLIHGIITTGGMSVIYGPPGEGKSFIALDMALSIATGGSWQDCKVEQGPVLYIAAEGAPGVGKRVRAWHHTRGVTLAQTPMAWLTQPIEVNGDDESNLDLLMERIANELEWAPKLIVIDTLARCFDGDENTQIDMGRFVAGVDKMRFAFNCAVLVVHHTRLDGDRERGNTALRGAADTMMAVSKSGWRVNLACTKQKDSEDFLALDLLMKPVEQFDSCVLAVKRRAVVVQKGHVVLALLAREGALSFDEIVASLKTEQKMSRASVARYLVRLRENDQIIKQNGRFALSETVQSQFEKEGQTRLK